MLAKWCAAFGNLKCFSRYIIKSAQKNLLKGIRAALSGLAFVYSLYSLIQKASGDQFPPFPFNLTTVAVVFCAAFVWWAAEEFHKLNHQTYFIQGKSASVGVYMGDILSRKDGTILIGISNRLDPDAVRDDSIHEQLKQRYGMKWLRKAFENGKEP